MIGQNVCFSVPLHTIESAKRAELFADVRVIDIAINDVADHIVRMPPIPDFVGSFRQIEQIRLFKHQDRLVRRHPCTVY
jgi:hypothetical protein